MIRVQPHVYEMLERIRARVVAEETKSGRTTATCSIWREAKMGLLIALIIGDANAYLDKIYADSTAPSTAPSAKPF